MVSLQKTHHSLSLRTSCWLTTGVIRLALTATLLPLYSYANVDNKNWESRHISAVQQYILPNYKVLLTNASLTRANIHKACTTKEQVISTIDQQVIQQNFLQLYVSWATVQPIHFGPISYLKRQVRMQYWPDKHNVGSRQIKKLLSSSNDISLEDLQKKSVAVQGLPALEKILFSLTTITPKNCLIAYRISENIESIAKQNYAGWTEKPAMFMNDFLAINYAIGSYSSAEEITAVMEKSISHYLQFIEQVKLSAIPANINKRTKPRRLEAWRSRISTKLIHHNINSLHTLYNLVFAEIIRQKNSTLGTKIEARFSSLQHLTHQSSGHLIDELIGNNKTSLYDKLNNTQDTREFILWKAELRELQRLIQRAFTHELGLQSSFNSLDGD
ncbi:MAG: putative lipoprotein [Granulosicoccus sp.]|jgi:predicted lipoprotein